MHESSDWVYTLTLTRDELITLTIVMEAANSNQYQLQNGLIETGKRMLYFPENAEELAQIYSRLVEMDLCPHQAQPTVDMAAVNQAFTRIREALAEADQAINSQNEV